MFRIEEKLNEFIRSQHLPIPVQEIVFLDNHTRNNKSDFKRCRDILRSAESYGFCLATMSSEEV